MNDSRTATPKKSCCLDRKDDRAEHLADRCNGKWASVIPSLSGSMFHCHSVLGSVLRVTEWIQYRATKRRKCWMGNCIRA
jgi:hypothetical protein